MRRCLFCATMMVSALAWADAGEGLVEREDRSAWHFRVGPVLSPRVRSRVNAPRITPRVLPANGSTSAGNIQSELDKIGSATGYADREYVDGYVRPDEGTADPESDPPGLTWDWGADDVASQYNGGKMEFRTDMTRWEESYSSSSSFGGSGSESRRDLFVGVEAMGGWTFYEDETFDVSIDGGFRFYGCDCYEAGSKYDASVTTMRNEYRVVDRYDDPGWTTIPNGEHIGSETADPNRLLVADPERDEELMNSMATEQTYHYSSHAKLNYRIWDLRMGPTFGWKATERLTIRGGTYLLIGLVDASLKATSYSPEGATRRKASTCGGVFGAAFGVSAQYNVTENLFLMAGVEYDLWARDVVLNAGGSSAEIKLSDMSITLGLGFEF